MDNDAPSIPDDTDELPGHVRESVADWFEETTNEQRFEWANENDAHDTLQRMMTVREEVEAEREQRHKERLSKARKKDYDELTRSEKVALVKEDGASALGQKQRDDNREGMTRQEVLDHVRETGKHPRAS